MDILFLLSSNLENATRLPSIWSRMDRIGEWGEGHFRKLARHEPASNSTSFPLRQRRTRSGGATDDVAGPTGGVD